MDRKFHVKLRIVGGDNFRKRKSDKASMHSHQLVLKQLLMHDHEQRLSATENWDNGNWSNRVHHKLTDPSHCH